MLNDGTSHPILNECLAVGETSDDELLNCVISGLSKADDNLALSIDFVFLMFSTALVFFMQAGFAMVCAGSVRRKNVQNSMLKNLLDACGAAIGFWTFGHAFAYGGETSFIGNSEFALQGLDPKQYTFWLFQFAFAATSATIVAGTLAERCQMIAYLCYSLVLSGFVYPIVVRAVWSQYGFLNFSNGTLFGEDSNIGMIDFAGGGVVHTTGGITALLATKILGPRKGRFFDVRGRKLDVPKPFPGHSAALQVLGTFILWLGWYGFNCGSIVSISRDKGGTSGALIASLTAVNTTLAASAAGISALFTKLYRTERRTGEATFDLIAALNGTLAGLVSVTAGCAIIEPWAALVTGIFAGWIYLFTSNLLIKNCIDDAVDAIPVHLANGAWGVLAVGLFASPQRLVNLYGMDALEHVGWFYEWGRGSGNGTLLAAQIVGLIFILVWTLGVMSPFFIILNYLGWFRSDSLEEVVGLDISYHGSELYFDSHQEEVNPEYLEEYQRRKSEKRTIGSVSSAEFENIPPQFTPGPHTEMPMEVHQPYRPEHPVLTILKNRENNAYNPSYSDTFQEEGQVEIPIHQPHPQDHPVLSILKNGEKNEHHSSQLDTFQEEDKIMNVESDEVINNHICVSTGIPRAIPGSHKPWTENPAETIKKQYTDDLQQESR